MEVATQKGEDAIGAPRAMPRAQHLWNLGASSRRVHSEHKFVPSSQPRDCAGNSTSNLSGRLTPAASQPCWLHSFVPQSFS